MSTNTPAKSFGFGLVIDHRDSEPSIWIQRDEEAGAGYFVNLEQATALRDALDSCITAHERWAARKVKSLASKAAA